MQKLQTEFKDGVNQMEYVATAEISAGDIVLIPDGADGNNAWIALDDIANTAKGIVVRENFSLQLPKAATSAILQGDALYWSGASVTVTGSTVATFAGYATELGTCAAATQRLILGGSRPNNET